MAVLSKYKHLVGITPRLMGFNTSNMIIDNKVYDKDFNLLNDNLAETFGDAHELISTNCVGWSDTVKNNFYMQAAHADAWIDPLTDVSKENSPYGFFSAPDPYENGISYTVTSVRSASNKSKAAACLTINKLSEDGTILARRSFNEDSGMSGTSPVYGKILDITDKYIFLLYRGYYSTGYQSTSYYVNSLTYYYPFRVMVLNKENFNTITYLAALSGDGENRNHQEPFYQVLARTNDKYWVFDHYKNAPFYVDKTNPAGGYKTVAKKSTTVKNRPYTVNYARTPNGGSTSNTFVIPAVNLTHAINGWHYYLHWETSITQGKLAFQAFKIDTEQNQYETINYDDMEVTVSDKCYNGAKPVNHADTVIAKAISTGGTLLNNYYFSRKVNETDFIIIHGCSGGNGTYTETKYPTFKTRYLYVHVDPDDPSKLTIENEQKLDFAYDGMPILMDNNKFGFVKPNKGIDVYRVNSKTYELELYWEVSTPDIAQATWFNGYLWWVNSVTNELHYEMEDSTKTIKASLDSPIYQLDSLDDPVEAIYSVEVLDSNNDRIASNLQLNCTGPCEFSNGLTVKTITTSAADVTKETVMITGAGKPRVTAKIVS